MASLQASKFLVSSLTKQIHAATKLPLIRCSASCHTPISKADSDTTKLQHKVFSEDLNTKNGFIKNTTSVPMATLQLYAILEAIYDRVEMHKNIGEQRDSWNTLLLNSINMMTLTAATMSGVVATTGEVSVSVSGLKLASTVMFLSATGMLVLMNKIQPSQLVEEQRNATRLFKQLGNRIRSIIDVGSPSNEDVKDGMEKVLALDKAYPLPLLGVMLEKFPEKLEPAVWWPKIESRKSMSTSDYNGWTKELEMEMRQVVDVIKRKDSEDYERLGNKALKINKVLAISGPMLTGIAALGSAFNNPLAAIIAAVAGALATTVNSFEHGCQVGMVFEMYRNNAGFFKLVQETIESTLDESDVERRENGELFEMKVALQLGRSLSELRDVAKKSSYSRIEGSPIDEFASKLF